MKEVAASLGPSLSESGLKKLAVVEFTDLNGYRSALGPFLAEELTTQLFEAKPGPSISSKGNNWPKCWQNRS